jgi:hypothetical protein
MLWPTVIQPVRLDVKPNLAQKTRFLILSDSYEFLKLPLNAHIGVTFFFVNNKMYYLIQHSGFFLEKVMLFRWRGHSVFMRTSKWATSCDRLIQSTSSHHTYLRFILKLSSFPHPNLTDFQITSSLQVSGLKQCKSLSPNRKTWSTALRDKEVTFRVNHLKAALRKFPVTGHGGP